MLHIIEPAIFGAVQGLAEFLPISSSGHLLLLHSVTHFSVGDDLTFDVALHAGTLLALVLYFWRDLWNILVAWLKSFRHWNIKEDANQRLAWLLVLASVPGAIAGVLLEKTADTAFRSPLLVGIVLIIAGVVLWIADRYNEQRDDMDKLGWGKALLIGVAQAIALIPGVSRSGATITLGRFLKLKRDAAAKFSFLMSAPILLGAVAKKMYDLRHVTVTSTQRWDFVVGIIVAAVVGFLAIRVLLRYISNHSYAVFMWYRVVLGVITIAVVLIAR